MDRGDFQGGDDRSLATDGTLSRGACFDRREELPRVAVERHGLGAPLDAAPELFSCRRHERQRLGERLRIVGSAHDTVDSVANGASEAAHVGDDHRTPMREAELHDARLTRCSVGEQGDGRAEKRCGARVGYVLVADDNAVKEAALDHFSAQSLLPFEDPSGDQQLRVMSPIDEARECLDRQLHAFVRADDAEREGEEFRVAQRASKRSYLAWVRFVNRRSQWVEQLGVTATGRASSRRARLRGVPVSDEPLGARQSEARQRAPAAKGLVRDDVVAR